MNQATAIGRLSILAVGLGIGAAVAATPGVASADPSSDGCVDRSTAGSLPTRRQPATLGHADPSAGGSVPHRGQTATATSDSGRHRDRHRQRRRSQRHRRHRRLRIRRRRQQHRRGRLHRRIRLRRGLRLQQHRRGRLRDHLHFPGALGEPHPGTSRTISISPPSFGDTLHATATTGSFMAESCRRGIGDAALGSDYLLSLVGLDAFGNPLDFVSLAEFDLLILPPLSARSPLRHLIDHRIEIARQRFEALAYGNPNQNSAPLFRRVAAAFSLGLWGIPLIYVDDG